MIFAAAGGAPDEIVPGLGVSMRVIAGNGSGRQNRVEAPVPAADRIAVHRVDGHFRLHSGQRLVFPEIPEGLVCEVSP